MSHDLTDLELLIDLAKEPSSERRRQLLRDITDIFLRSPEGYSQTQTGYFGEIMQQVAFDLEKNVRVDLSEKMAASEYAPHHLIKALANDDIEVAEPVLQQSPVLTDDDLIELSRRHSQDHLRAITRRDVVSENVSRALVSHGDADTVGQLLQNQNARLADDTVETIAERSKEVEQLQAPLIQRAEISKDVLDVMSCFVSPRLKQDIARAAKRIDEAQVTDKMEERAAALIKSKAQLAEEMVKRLSSRGMLTEDRLIKFLREREAMEFLFAIAEMCNIDVPTARRVIEDKTGKSMVVLCKAMRLSPESFKEIAMSPITGLAEKPQDMLNLLTIYNKFEYKDAARVMRFWKTRKHTMDKSEEDSIQDEMSRISA